MKNQLIAMGNGAHALALQILGNSEDAADAVHDAFAAVLASPGSYDRNRGAFRTWFLRVVRNRCVDQLRSRKHTEPVDTLASKADAPETALETEQRDMQLQRALMKLGRDQREIIVLRDYLDLSYAEIAAVLDIAAGTVMSRLHRARLALRAKLEDSYE